MLMFHDVLDEWENNVSDLNPWNTQGAYDIAHEVIFYQRGIVVKI